MKLWTSCMCPALKMNVNCWKNSGNTSITCNWPFDLCSHIIYLNDLPSLPLLYGCHLACSQLIYIIIKILIMTLNSLPYNFILNLNNYKM